MILIQYEGIWGILWDMGGYGGIWNQWSARPQGSHMGPRVPARSIGSISPHIPPYPTISPISPHIVLRSYIYMCIYIYIIFRVPWISCIFQTRFRFYFFSRIPGSGYLVGISCGRNSTVTSPVARFVGPGTPGNAPGGPRGSPLT